jgi:hypothetical protein
MSRHSISKPELDNLLGLAGAGLVPGGVCWSLGWSLGWSLVELAGT